MDTGLGKLEPISDKVAKEIMSNQTQTGSVIPSVFRVGGILPIKGSHFRILKIGESKMKLKLLSEPWTKENVMGYDHLGWQPLMKLLSLLVDKYSGVIYDKELHRKWDIGQALCRGTYGKNWNTHPQKLKDDDAEVAPQAAMNTARSWLENGLPKWAEPG